MLLFIVTALTFNDNLIFTFTVLNVTGLFPYLFVWFFFFDKLNDTTDIITLSKRFRAFDTTWISCIRYVPTSCHRNTYAIQIGLCNFFKEECREWAGHGAHRSAHKTFHVRPGQNNNKNNNSDDKKKKIAFQQFRVDLVGKFFHAA